jgi:transposase
MRGVARSDLVYRNQRFNFSQRHWFPSTVYAVHNTGVSPRRRRLRCAAPKPVDALVTTRQDEVAPVAGIVDRCPPDAETSGAPRALVAQKGGAERERSMRCVALDLGLRKISFAEARDGRIVKRATVKPAMLLAELGPGTPTARILVEAGRLAWHYHDLLTSWGHEVLIADTTRVRQLGVGHHGRKNDRIDADVLALALESGKVPLAHILSVGRRRLRNWLLQRNVLVRTRTRIINAVRGECTASGVFLKACRSTDFNQMFNEDPAVTPALCEATSGLRRVLDSLNAEIGMVEGKIVAFAETDEGIQRLMTAPGVAVIVACWFVAVLDDAGRFTNGHSVASYLGLCPLEDSSGGIIRRGRITGHGNSCARTVLLQAAWSIMRSADPDDPLRVWSNQLAKRRGKPIAAVAVARRLCGILWAIWKSGSTYDPQTLAKASERGLRNEEATTRHNADMMKRSSEKLGRQRSQSKRLAKAATTSTALPLTPRPAASGV